MRLSKLLKDLPSAEIVYDKDDYEREISGLYIDSREMRTSGLFICLTGGKKDGHDYVQEAIKLGAVAIMTERRLPVSVPQILVKDTREGLSYIAASFYGNPSQDLKIIGITGTNGKTTTSYMLSSILRRAGKSVATVGTLGVQYGRKKLPATLTTPDPIEMQKAYADMVACGVEYVVEEVSAHALHYKKQAGIKFCACIFTNLTQDHLDFFGDMQAYKQAKLTLFDKEKCDLAVVNSDDACSQEIAHLREGEKVVSYGLESPADCFAVMIGEGMFGQHFMLNLQDDLCRVSLKLIGKHNVYNALAAATCAYELGVNAATIAGGLCELAMVEGRLQWLCEYAGGNVFLDFAHTPDGLENSLKTLKRYTTGRLICLFGCGGNRDKEKRALMGEVAAKLADFCVLTSDNPRYEDPLDIISAIEKGYRKVSNRYVIVPDRAQAIEYAVDVLKKGDVLLLAGKGGEETQEIMGINYPFKDQDVLRKTLAMKEKIR